MKNHLSNENYKKNKNTKLINRNNYGEWKEEKKRKKAKMNAGENTILLMSHT